MEIIITPQAEKHLQKIPKSEQTKITRKIFLLQTEPLAGKKLTGVLSQLRSLRAWPYRIIYHIHEKTQIVHIVTIAHRQGVYK